jgi:hypothetical protein
MTDDIKCDRKGVDVVEAPKKTKPVWSWECEQFNHKNETPPAKAPDKCDGKVPTPWGPMPCPSDGFKKTGEGIKVIE